MNKIKLISVFDELLEEYRREADTVNHDRAVSDCADEDLNNKILEFREKFKEALEQEE